MPGAPAPAILEGRIVDADTGEPIANADVWVKAARLLSFGTSILMPERVRERTRSDLEGRFRLTLNNACNVVQVVLEGYRQLHPARRCLSSNGNETVERTIKLQRVGGIFGRVIDADGEPVANAVVRCQRWRVRSLGSSGLPPALWTFSQATTNERGEYRLDSISPGRYVVSAHPPGSVLGTVFYSNVTEAQSAGLVNILPGNAAPLPDLQLQRGPTFAVSGRISGCESFPRELMSLVLLPQPDYLRMELRAYRVPCDEHGQFSVRDVPRNSYVLTLAHHSRLFAHQQFTVSDRDVQNLLLVAAPGSVLQGHLRVEGSPRFESFGVGLVSQFQRTEVAVHGVGPFEIPHVIPASYRLEFQELPEGLFPSLVRLNGKVVHDDWLELTGGVSGELEVTLESGAPELTGQVFDEFQRPADRPQVLLFNTSLELVSCTLADEQGRYRIGEMRPGNYLVIATEIDLRYDADPTPLAAQSLPITLARHESRRLDLQRVLPEAAT